MWSLNLLLFYITWTTALDKNVAGEKLMYHHDHATVKDKCLTKLGFTPDDLKRDVDTSDIPENVLCFLKCIQQELGYIDEAGSFQSEKLRSTPRFATLSENEQNELLKCVEGVAKIETCQDVAPVLECLHERV